MGEHAVGEMVAALGLPQPAVSKHLGVLRKVGSGRQPSAGFVPGTGQRSRMAGNPGTGAADLAEQTRSLYSIVRGQCQHYAKLPPTETSGCEDRLPQHLALPGARLYKGIPIFTASYPRAGCRQMVRAGSLHAPVSFCR